VTAGRWGSPRAAWFAALVYLTTPWVYRLAELPYVEGPLCAFHAALIWSLCRAWTWTGCARLLGRLWSVVGLLAGGAMACKYPALISAVLPFGCAALTAAIRHKSGRLLLAYVAGWGAIMTPWLAKNVIDTGNPVYPLAYKVFGARQWDADREAKWTAAHGPRPISAAALGAALLDVAGRSDWHSPLYAALAPLALLRRGSRRLAGALWSYVAYLFLTWWLLTHRLDRFWLPLLPALAVLAGLGADWTRNWAWSILLGLMFALATVLNFTVISTALTGLNEWTGDLRVLRTRVPSMTNPALAWLDTHLPPHAKVLLVGQAAVFHMNHPVVYNTVFNRETFETLAHGRTPAEVARALHERGISHVYVDWFEIDRYRSPGNYGFTPFVTPKVFSELVAAGVLEPGEAIARRQQLYRVR
jgi:4-amino-4-deoxy-L-arabinose transferase-like glycosyltransferase